jgi:hypothetical protein
MRANINADNQLLIFKQSIDIGRVYKNENTFRSDSRAINGRKKSNPKQNVKIWI